MPSRHFDSIGSLPLDSQGKPHLRGAPNAVEHLDANAAKTAERLVYDEEKRKAAADGTSLDNSNK